MKKFLKSAAFVAGFLSLLVFSGCSNGLEQRFEPGSSTEKSYGTLVVGSKSSRAVQVDEISAADVCVLGSDMAAVYADSVKLSGGKGSFSIENIPVGKNRVVQVQAKSGNSADSKIDGICLTAVVDIVSDENILEEINWASSVKGNVYKALIEAGVKTADFGDAQEKAVESAIPPETHALLVDSKKIASDYKENPERAFDSSDYVLKPGKISVSAENASGYKIWLNDPLSSAEKVEISSDKSYSIENVAPGSWTLYIENNSQNIEKRSVSVASGGTCPAGKIGEEQTFEGFRVHFYGAKWSSYGIYYYNSKTVTVSDWEKMPSMVSEENGYYYDLTEDWVSAGKTMVIFYGGNDSNRYPADQQDGVVLPSGVKEAWFNFGTKKFETKNPFSTEPVVAITPGGNVSFSGASQGVTLSAKNCASAKYTTDGSDPKTSSTAVSFVSGESITVGSGISIGESVTLKVWGTDGTLEASASAVYTKVEKPATPTRLGAYYTSTATSFSIWSPDSSDVTVTVKPVGGTEQTYTCTKGFKVDGDYPDAANIYGVSVPGDLHLAEYQFKIGKTAVRDPYGKMVKYDGNQQKTNKISDGTENGYSYTSYAGPSVNIVVDMEKTEPAGGWAVRPVLENRCDAIVYEVHVGDFTSDSSWGGSSENAGKFPGMVESGTSCSGVSTGLDHLKELGVTHVQLLPMYDFATKYNNTLNDIYNWGYDPVNYNVPEDRYSTCPGDYVERIREVKEMINEFHRNGIRVIMDVVYNHTFAKEMFSSISSKYYTTSADGGTGEAGNNGDLSGCGNSINTGVSMVSRMIRDSLEYWAEEYNLDGFRFDLIGIYHTSAVKEWGEYLNNTKFPDRNLLMYGEPWNGYATDRNESAKIRMSAVSSLSGAHVGVFNGKFRQSLKGANDKPAMGYIFNANEDDGTAYAANIAVGLKGSGTSLDKNGCSDTSGTWTRFFTVTPDQSINYMFAHDNLCYWDKIKAAGKTSYGPGIVKFGHGILFVSQGIPFIHAGDEFLRTKEKGAGSAMSHNSYMAGTETNSIDWNLKKTNKAVSDYHSDLIKLRKAHDGLRYRNGVGTTETSGNAVIYKVQDTDGTKLCIVVNPGNNISSPVSGTTIFDINGASPASTGCEGTAVTVIKY